MAPSVCELALFTLFMSLVSNVVNTDDIIQVIFPRCFNNVASILNRAYVKKIDDING